MQSPPPEKFLEVIKDTLMKEERADSLHGQHRRATASKGDDSSRGQKFMTHCPGGRAEGGRRATGTVVARRADPGPSRSPLQPPKAVEGTDHN